MSVATSTPTPAVVRGALDRLVSLFGAVLVVVFLVAGGVAAYASSFIKGQVHDQLSQQGITMPTEDSFSGDSFTDADRAALKPFVGQPMTTGAQAKAFADHYIWVHMNAASGGKTYEEVSSEYLALDDKTTDEAVQMGQLRQTLFMGNTLRGLLLNAYAFGTMGIIAGYVSIAAFVAAVVMAVLVFLGLRHSKQVVVKA